MRTRTMDRCARAALVATLVAAASLAPALAEGQDGCLAFPPPAARYPIDAVASGVAIGDIDGDGDADLAVSLSTESGYAILRNLGGGRFGPALVVSLGERIEDVALADVDGDGDLDLVLADSRSVFVLQGDGAGAFGPPVEHAAESCYGIELGDADNDGDLDIFVGYRFVDAVGLLVNDGDGGFAPIAEIALPDSSAAFALGDIDGDGALDILATSRDRWSRMVFGDGAGGYGPPLEYLYPNSVYGAALADVDGDGDLDPVVGDEFSEALLVRPNLGDRMFGPRVATASLARADELRAADLNGDGKDDLVHALTPAVMVHVAGEDGHLGPLAGYAASERFGSVAVGDIDGDGAPDVAATAGRAVEVLPNRGDGRLAGRFGAKGGIGAGGAVGLAAADLTGDGVPDVAMGNYLEDVAVFHGNGMGPLSLAGVTQTTRELGGLAAADFDHDGFADLAAKATRGGGLAVLLNDGLGGFPSQVFFDAGGDAPGVVAADLNGDGHADIAVANNDTSEVLVYLGDGAGGFAAPEAFDAGRTGYFLEAADMDGDGAIDLIGGGDGAFERRVAVLANDGLGRFTVRYSGLVRDETRGISLGDLDGDGVLDVAVAHQRGFDMLRNTGDGTLEPLGQHDRTNALGVAVGDFDGDGYADVAGIVEYEEVLVVLMNQRDGTFLPEADRPMIRQGVVADATAIESADLDGDGRDDLIIGTLGGSGDLPLQIMLAQEVCPICPADLDGDGELTIFDFLAFGNLFDLMDPAADFDGDGEFTIFDFLAFQNAFDAGCV